VGNARIQIFHWRVGSYENSCLFKLRIIQYLSQIPRHFMMLVKLYGVSADYILGIGDDGTDDDKI
jgi:hypothetical protein